MARASMLLLAATLALGAGCSGLDARGSDGPCASCPRDDGGGSGEGGIDDGNDGDGDVDGAAPQPKIVPNGTILAAYDYQTIRPGGSVDFRGRALCPAAIAPCSFKWSFGNGQTSATQNPGKIRYATAGWYTATLVVSGKGGVADPTPATQRIAVWSGSFTDNFNRIKLDETKHGWRPVFGSLTDALYAQNPLYRIVNNQLRVSADWREPGSTALVGWPRMHDAHVEVTLQRFKDNTKDHFTDIVCRMHPSGGIGRFYRVRTFEMPDEPKKKNSASIQIAIFKIWKVDDQHGILLNDRAVPASKRPVQCTDCPTIYHYPRDRRIRIIVELKGNTFDARIEDADIPGKVLVRSKATDTFGPPLDYDGFWGLTQFANVSLFDDFKMYALPKK